jgi:hypothetical protein
MKMKTLAMMVNAALIAMAMPAMADQGPSTTTAPYVHAIAPDVQFTSVLTTGDIVGGYKMGGIPDGLGAYENDDGTFTVLMNHEIFADASGPVGVVRAHGGKGAYVSQWIINKKTLEVVSGADLIKNVYQQASDGSWLPVPATGALGQTSSFARFCSADLADVRAFFNSATRKGTKHRIFLNGEESAPTYQRGLAHVATGPHKGSSYVLPWAAAVNASWENLLANPYSGDRTVVIGNADGGTNGVYVYVGTKTNHGNDIERAGLVGGTLYRVVVSGNLPETRAADAGLGLVVNASGNYEGAFTLVAGADTTNAVSTKFLRPEDGAWDKKNHNRYFFVTTDQMDAAKDGNLNADIKAGQAGRSRLWALNFKDSSKPQLGGTIEMLLDGTDAKGDYQMFDNITVNDDGSLIMLEDVGNNQHNGKIWKFEPATGLLVKLAGFDSALFGDIGVVGSITKDEETSGVIDVTDILDRDDDKVYNLFVAQNHALSGDAETVEGGQLLLMSRPAPKHDDGDGHHDGRHHGDRDERGDRDR